jgi:O-antigen/teichoic acid export membrane protein
MVIRPRRFRAGGAGRPALKRYLALALNSLYAPGAALLLAGRVVQLLNALVLSIVIVRRFGLEMVGTFAVGFIGVAVLTVLSPMGLPSHLPRLRAAHEKLSFAALAIQLAMLPVFGATVYGYARLQATDPRESATIFVVAIGGVLIGASNTGLMLSIMRSRFLPGLLSPLCEAVGILVGAALATSGLALATYLLMGRLAGATVIWSGFRFQSVSMRRVAAIARRGIGYSVPDLLALLSEQSAPLLLATMATRADLGLFRLCQQMLNAADTPGWTFVQSKYPELVRDRPGVSEHVYEQVRRLGAVAAVMCVAGSIVLATDVYRIPTIGWMMAVLAPSLFWRYKNNYFEQRFRATGQLAVTTTLSLLKLCAAVPVFFLAIQTRGAWGAIWALAALSVVAGITYEHVYRRRPATVEAF